MEYDQPPYGIMPAEQKRHLVFETNRNEILSFEGRGLSLRPCVPNEKVSVELEIAYARERLTGIRQTLVVLYADSRASFLDTKPNSILRVPLDHLVESEKELNQPFEQHACNYA